MEDTAQPNSQSRGVVVITAAYSDFKVKYLYFNLTSSSIVISALKFSICFSDLNSAIALLLLSTAKAEAEKANRKFKSRYDD